MTDLKPLIDAVAFVKANPDKYDQGQDFFDRTARCIISYAASNIGQDTTRNYPNIDDLAAKMCVSSDELNSIYNCYNCQEALNLAEALIAKYEPVKYPVGTKIKGYLTGTVSTIVTVMGDKRKFEHPNAGTNIVSIADLDERWTIVEDEVTTPEFEYVVTFDGNINVIDTFDNADSAKIAARAIVAYRANVDGYTSHPVKVIQRPTKPAEVEIDF